MHHLARLNLDPAGQRLKVVGVAKVGVTVSKGVRHLRHDHRHFAFVVVAEPERHRVKHMSPEPRLGQKLNPCRRRQVIGAEDIAYPRRTSASAGRATVIDVM